MVEIDETRLQAIQAALKLRRQRERETIERVSATLGLPGGYADTIELTEAIIADPAASKLARELVKASPYRFGVPR
jgi:hypothetical protein